MKWRLVVVALILILLSSAVDCELDGVGEWQMLTKQNFSSQILFHPHILLLITVPWCGESRSLMKEVAHMVSDRQEEFVSLKLMFIYRNVGKMLADAMGAAEGITISYYHHSVSYKYQGRLRAQRILFSIYPYLSVSPEELPLRHLNTQLDLKTFLDSTDKALLLLEFCGWTRRLLANVKKNGTENDFGLRGDLSRTSFNGEADRIPMPKGRDNQKGVDHGNLMCSLQNGLGGIPWLMEFSSVNDSAPFWETDNKIPGLGLTCTFEGFQQFESFFSKFISVVKEFFLPPERHRFGLVTERSLLSSLGVGDSGSWLAMLHFTGCPSCSKILKEGDDLKSILQMDNSIVAELEGDGQDLEPALPANKPSIILFVDRSYDSSETRRKGKEALDSLRELAARYQVSDQTGWENVVQPDKSSDQVYQAFRSTSGHPRLKLSSTAENMKLNDKMSIMVIDEGKDVTLDNVASDLQGSSLHEILTHLLQRKKETKLSSLSKEVGFRLLSNDLDIKMSNMLPSQTKDQSNQVSVSPSEEDVVTSSVDQDKDNIPSREIISAAEHKTETKSTEVEPSSHCDMEKKISADTSKQSISLEGDQLELAKVEDVKVEEKDYSQVDSGLLRSFKGSFFFSDGNYRLLRALTGGAKIPSLVIIDPTRQQHYIFPEEIIFSHSSLADFLHGYLNGSLLPYQRSESILQSPREATPSPFVNLDFHEVDSIPRVTTSTFSKLVLGFNQSDIENASRAWNEDVLVLFSSSWCGFCQRMELVVREVYRAIKGYLRMKSGSRIEQMVVSAENMMNVTTKPPLVYLMDCTLNDCSLILKSITQREVYPALMLFPAERKEAVSYEGDISVADVIKFIAHHGSNSRHFLSKKGILWTVTGKGVRNQNLFYSSPATVHEEAPARDKFHEILLENRVPEKVIKYNLFKSHASKGLHERNSHVIVGSILIATDKLLTVPLFDKSMIIIVKADQDTGFEGLIFNKHIRWDSLRELEEGLEFLKEAPLSFGGPLIKRGTPFVALTRGVANKDQYPEVVPGVYFLDQSATIQEIEELKSRNRSITDYWFFLGYSNWGWDQLFDEIDEGAWTINDDNTGYLTWP